MTLEEMGYRILRRLEGGDIPRDKTWDIREIMDTAAQVRDKITKRYIDSQLGKEGWDVPPELVSWFRNVEVLEDTVLELKYVVLPARFASLPFSQGIAHVSSMRDPGENYKLSQPGVQSMFKHMRESFTTVWPQVDEGENRLYIDKLPRNVDKLYIGMVVSTDSISENDPLPMLSWMEADVEDEVFRKYMPPAPTDNLNNTTDVGKVV
jgi:hypothetical protein